MHKTLSAISLVFLFAAQPAQAFVDEVRLGVMAHDVGIFGGEHEDGVDLDGEVLFDSPPVLDAIWSPRPHLGLSLNSAGDTSLAYGGLTWTWEPSKPLFVDFSLGGALHNGKLDTTDRNRISLGSRVLFRESLSLGIRLDDRNSISIMLAHVSNANLANRNEGMDQIGLRWGRKF